jgi:lysophospholipase L1-like esterase
VAYVASKILFLIKLIAVLLSMQQVEHLKGLKYLALGDSYTIGELMPEADSFPFLLQQVLSTDRIYIDEVQIIAQTGWTTDELIGPMETTVTRTDYDWVTILIGVNNQYRGRSVAEYEIHFRYIASRALFYCGQRAHRIVVLSIPDWGLTPFNVDRDTSEISAAIDEYNRVNKLVADELGFNYLDITASTREHAQNHAYLASDLLHPGKQEYVLWAQRLASIIRETS